MNYLKTIFSIVMSAVLFNTCVFAQQSTLSGNDTKKKIIVRKEIGQYERFNPNGYDLLEKNLGQIAKNSDGVYFQGTKLDGIDQGSAQVEKKCISFSGRNDVCSDFYIKDKNNIFLHFSLEKRNVKGFEDEREEGKKMEQKIGKILYSLYSGDFQPIPKNQKLLDKIMNFMKEKHFIIDDEMPSESVIRFLYVLLDTFRIKEINQSSVGNYGRYIFSSYTNDYIYVVDRIDNLDALTFGIVGEIDGGDILKDKNGIYILRPDDFTLYNLDAHQDVFKLNDIDKDSVKTVIEKSKVDFQIMGEDQYSFMSTNLLKDKNGYYRLDYDYKANSFTISKETEKNILNTYCSGGKNCITEYSDYYLIQK